MAAIKKRSLVDQVYEMLRGDIITLRRPLGSKLNVNELQDELGVSCTPIREAVNRLQQEGLVVYENNVGAHILDLDQHDITEIEQLAMTLHCAAIRLAMAHGDRAAIVTGLEKYLEEYRRARNVQSEVMAVRLFSLGLLLYLMCDMLVAVSQFPSLFPAPLSSVAQVGMWLFYLPGQVLIVLSGLVIPTGGVPDETE